MVQEAHNVLICQVAEVHAAWRAHMYAYLTVHMLAWQLTKAQTPLIQFTVDFLYEGKV